VGTDREIQPWSWTRTRGGQGSHSCYIKTATSNKGCAGVEVHQSEGARGRGRPPPDEQTDRRTVPGCHALGHAGLVGGHGGGRGLRKGLPVLRTSRGAQPTVSQTFSRCFAPGWRPGKGPATLRPCPRGHRRTGSRASSSEKSSTSLFRYR